MLIDERRASPLATRYVKRSCVQRQRVLGKRKLVKFLRRQDLRFVLIHLRRVNHEQPPSPLLKRTVEPREVIIHAARQAVDIHVDGNMIFTNLHPDLIKRFERDVETGDHIDEYHIDRQFGADFFDRYRLGYVFRAFKPLLPFSIIERDLIRRTVELVNPGDIDVGIFLETCYEFVIIILANSKDGKNRIIVREKIRERGNREENSAVSF